MTFTKANFRFLGLFIGVFGMFFMQGFAQGNNPTGPGNPSPNQPEGVIIDGIFKLVDPNNFYLPTKHIYVTGCLIPNRDWVQTSYDVTLRVNPSQISNLRLNIEREDGNGNPLILVSQNQYGYNATLDFDLVNMTGSIPFQLIGSPPIQELTFTLHLVSTIPTTYPQDQDLITKITMEFQDNSPVFQPHPNVHHIHQVICAVLNPPGGGTPPKAQRLAGTEDLSPTLNVSPNPFSNGMKIEMPEISVRHEVQLIDVQGKVIRKGTLFAENPLISWNTHDLKAGIYFVLIRNGLGDTWHQKVVKID